jgi:hypothetical protein
MTLTIFIWLFKSISSVPIGLYVVFPRAKEIAASASVQCHASTPRLKLMVAVS